MKRLLLLAAIFLLSTGWTIRTLPTLPGGGLCLAQALNVSGEAVGYAFNASGLQRAVFWNKAGAITEIPTPAISGRYYQAYDINNLGWVVGHMGTSASPSHAFKWVIGGGTVTDLGTSSVESRAFGISEDNHIAGQWTTSGSPPPGYAVVWPYGSTPIYWLGGFGGNSDYAADVAANAPVVVGTAKLTTGQRHAFLYIDGSPLRDLGTLGGNNSYGRAVSVGTWPDPTESTIYVVGESETVPGSFDTDAFVYHHGMMTNIGGLPGCTRNYAYGINRAGDVVGYSWCSGYSRAWIFRGGVMIDLMTLIPGGTGWSDLQFANDINEKGQIAGYGLYMGQGRGFIMTP